MFIVNIIERHYDKSDYSSFVTLRPLNSIQFKDKVDAMSWLIGQGFSRSYNGIYEKGDDIAYITELVAGYPGFSGKSWNEGHAE